MPHKRNPMTRRRKQRGVAGAVTDQTPVTDEKKATEPKEQQSCSYVHVLKGIVNNCGEITGLDHAKPYLASAGMWFVIPKIEEIKEIVEHRIESHTNFYNDPPTPGKTFQIACFYEGCSHFARSGWVEYRSLNGGFARCFTADLDGAVIVEPPPGHERLEPIELGPRSVSGL